jgi:hypothetical protein
VRAGLQQILNRISHIRGLHLDQAMEYCKHHFAAVVTYPLSSQTKKKSRDETDELPGTSKQEEPSRKKAKKEGKTRPKDDANFRKYGPKNLPKNLEPLILQHLQNDELFKENPELCEECLCLISNSLARRTWQKYGSALTLWQKFAKDKNVKGFPALAFLCWCRKNTTIKSATVKGYLSALRKIKFLLGFYSKKGKRTIEKIILRGMENIECSRAKQPKKIVPMDLRIMNCVKKGLRKSNLKNCTKKSVWTLNIVAFWGLLRLGEVLPGKAKRFDKTSV